MAEQSRIEKRKKITRKEHELAKLAFYGILPVRKKMLEGRFIDAFKELDELYDELSDYVNAEVRIK